MKTTNNTPAPVNYNAVPGLAWFFAWIDRHPRTSSALLWFFFALLAYTVYSYDFTTRI